MENIEAMLCAYIEGDLDEAGRAEIEKHLKNNPQHRKLIEELITTRNLVRGLPRVNAPRDVGDGVEGQVERSILLDSGESAAAVRGGGGMRWSQFLAIAAVFLLILSLALILINTVGPTLRPVTELQTAKISAPPDEKAATDGSDSATLDRLSLRGAAINNSPNNSKPLPTVPDEMNALTMGPPSAAPPNAGATLDIVALKQQLQSSGYSAPLNENAGSNGPVILVINSTDPATTEARVAEFLNNQASVSWQDLTHSQPSTQPSQLREEVAAAGISAPSLSGGSATGGGGGGASGRGGRAGGRGGGGVGGAGGGAAGAPSAAAPGNSPSTQQVLADKNPSAPTTEKDQQTSSPADTFVEVPQSRNFASNAIQPQRSQKSLLPPASSAALQKIETLYIAHGMTRQLAGDLQTALSNRADVSNTQVVGLADDLPATRPATQSANLGVSPQTQPADANRDAAKTATDSTSALPAQMQADAPVVSQVAQPAAPAITMPLEITAASDTVIVIQFAGVVAPATQPTATPASQP